MRVALVGRGRLGWALASALSRARYEVIGPLGRGYLAGELANADLVLLCVPDDSLAGAAHYAEASLRAIASRALIGHCSGAHELSILGMRPRLSLHPLMTVLADDDGGAFPGAGAAIAGSTDDALALARRLAEDLGMHPFELAEEDRAAYHAAASIASNFLVALEEGACRLLATAGGGRELLVPLVRRTVENWADRGPRALTGPIARGDEATVARQRKAVTERTPELIALFDALASLARTLDATVVAA